MRTAKWACLTLLLAACDNPQPEPAGISADEAAALNNAAAMVEDVPADGLAVSPEAELHSESNTATAGNVIE